jgi:hypothetical protein
MRATCSTRLGRVYLITLVTSQEVYLQIMDFLSNQTLSNLLSLNPSYFQSFSSSCRQAPSTYDLIPLQTTFHTGTKQQIKLQLCEF